MAREPCASCGATTTRRVSLRVAQHVEDPADPTLVSIWHHVVPVCQRCALRWPLDVQARRPWRMVRPDSEMALA